MLIFHSYVSLPEIICDIDMGIGLTQRTISPNGAAIKGG